MRLDKKLILFIKSEKRFIENNYNKSSATKQMFLSGMTCAYSRIIEQIELNTDESEEI